MRNGSAAIVPLLLAIMLLFWFIWFMGGENDNLHKVNQLENLHHTQERLVIAALRKKQELRDANASLSDAELNTKVNQYIHNIMILNKIDEK
ncbi:hypothetical protein [Sulfurimonas autotrophica]|uniref:Septum formation initiator n=1 Tax=Sulfurimonas autotrophica (strain ATCC BAA-671 / DSM 16294 / JCM 11897 / OK10) TaxID=563040 RepID=E0UQL6_SULAO|nr:hypothetical protein [Sulfurimonas autotrophica]ADN09888.1 hypothetical protein Saut_1844 [Sulfurimonas autotrophica DSM 16294]